MNTLIKQNMKQTSLLYEHANNVKYETNLRNI